MTKPCERERKKKRRGRERRGEREKRGERERGQFKATIKSVFL